MAQAASGAREGGSEGGRQEGRKAGSRQAGGGNIFLQRPSICGVMAAAPNLLFHRPRSRSAVIVQSALSPAAAVAASSSSPSACGIAARGFPVPLVALPRRSMVVGCLLRSSALRLALRSPGAVLVSSLAVPSLPCPSFCSSLSFVL